MPLPNDKNTSALQQLTFLDDLVASERRNISDVIFRRIRDAIISGELPPGYVFPNENELCKKLNIGRSSLREAYSPLETLKLISRSKAGTYVNDLDIYQNAMNFDAIGCKACNGKERHTLKRDPKKNGGSPRGLRRSFTV